MATLAIEVGVKIVKVLAIVLATVTSSSTHSILERPCAIVDGMDEVMSEEKGDGAVDGRLVHRVQFVLKAL